MSNDVLEDTLWLKAGQMMEATFKNLETKLEEKEKFAERWEADRQEKLAAERMDILLPLGYNTSFGYNLGKFTEEAFIAIKLGLEAVKKKKEDDEFIAEVGRIAEEERLAAIAEENKRLKAEADLLLQKEQAEKKANEDKAEIFIKLLLADGYKCTALDYFSKGEESGKHLGFGVSKEMLLKTSEAEFTDRMDEVNSILAERAQARDAMFAAEAAAKKQRDGMQAKADADLKAQREAADKLLQLNYKRNNELRPFIVFIRDYKLLLSLPENEYQDEFKEIKEAAELQWEFTRKEQIKVDLALKAQREDAANLQAQLNLKIQAERKAAKQKEDEAKALEVAAAKAAKAPDKKRLMDWIKCMGLDLPPVGLELHPIAIDIDNKFEAFKKWAITQIENL